MPTTPPSGTLSNPSSTPSDGPRNRPWPRTIFPRWSAPSPADLAATYDQHASLARWLSDHAPEDVTNELAAASDRAYHARSPAGTAKVRRPTCQFLSPRNAVATSG